MLRNSPSLTCLLPRDEQSDRSTATCCTQKKVTAISFPQNHNSVHCWPDSTLHMLLVFNTSFRLRNMAGCCIPHYSIPPLWVETNPLEKPSNVPQQTVIFPKTPPGSSFRRVSLCNKEKENKTRGKKKRSSMTINNILWLLESAAGNSDF